MAKQTVITTSEQVQSNMEVHGIVWTAKWAKRRGVCFTHFYAMAFGKAPKQLTSSPIAAVARFKRYAALNRKLAELQ